MPRRIPALSSLVRWLKDRRRLSDLTLVLVFMIPGLTLGCGGGGAGSHLPAVTPPANLVYPHSTIVAVVGQAIATDVPTITGTDASFAVTPSLPAGLSLNSSTGAISGTPTALAVAANYVVTASNSSGSASAGLQISVVAGIAEPPANLAYAQAAITAIAGQAITTDVATVTGTVSVYTVSPALPAGLSLNTITGAISGIPAASTPATTYVVTAINSGGSTSASVTIAVDNAPAVLLELGHDAQIVQLRFENSRVLSQDVNGHWVLWDYASGALLARGDQGESPLANGLPQAELSVEMAGQVFAIGLPAGLEVHSTADGHLLSTIAIAAEGTGNAWWQLASDGSYVCAGSQAGLFVWTPTGQLLVSRAGDYSAAQSFAAPGDVQVALGAAGQSVVETVSTTDGTSSVSPPFSGEFHSWFLDGEQFITNLSNTVWIYSKAGVQQTVVQFAAIDGLAGERNWLWTYSDLGGSLAIYSVGSATPVVVYGIGILAKVIPSGTTIGVLSYGAGAASVIDLSGQNPSKTDYTLPIAYATAYGATSSSQWIAGNTHGVILDGASLSTEPRYFGFGAAWSIAGATGRVAVATASGTILYFDPAVTTPEGSIGFSSGKAELSSDGTILAASASAMDYQYETDRTLNVFSLPSGSLIGSFPYTFDVTQDLFDFTLSESGTTLGQVLGTTSNQVRQVTAISGGPVIWSDMGPEDPIRLSPDGTGIAVSNSSPSQDVVTNIFRNGILVTAVPGFSVGWIDDDRILVDKYLQGQYSILYNGCAIYDATGVQLATPPLPELHSIQTVTPDSVYSPDVNAILSLTNGQATWTSPYGANGVGAVSGPYVVFEYGSRVLVDRY